MLILPPPRNTSKTYLHVEQISLKTTLRLAERLLYNKGFKKDTHTIQKEGKREISSGLTTHQRGHRRIWVWRSTLGSEQFKSHI